MLKSCLFVSAFLGGVTAFLTGAWTGSFAPSAELARPTVVRPESSTERDVAEVLDRAIAKLAGATWLRTQIRQTLSHAESSFVAQGTLQRGPHGCARLEMKVHSSGVECRLLVISDGAVVAVESAIGKREPIIICERLPGDGQSEYLAKLGCDGPAAVLRDLRVSLQNPTLQSGLLGTRRVVAIRGDTAPDAVLGFCQASVFLDAATLWPLRAEWRGQAMQTLEFHEEAIDQALNAQECEQAFSYQPNESK